MGPPYLAGETHGAVRAAILQHYGAPENLFVTDTPDPDLTSPTAVRVDVHASSINSFDWKIRAGYQRGAIRSRLPCVLGMDLSGVVAEVRPKVTEFGVGDQEYGTPSHTAPGCYA